MNCIDCGIPMRDDAKTRVEVEPERWITSKFRCEKCLRAVATSTDKRSSGEREAELEERVTKLENILKTLLADYTPSSFKSPEDQAKDFPTIPPWLWDYLSRPPGDD